MADNSTEQGDAASTSTNCKSKNILTVVPSKANKNRRRVLRRRRNKLRNRNKLRRRRLRKQRLLKMRMRRPRVCEESSARPVQEINNWDAQKDLTYWRSKALALERENNMLHRHIQNVHAHQFQEISRINFDIEHSSDHLADFLGEPDPREVTITKICNAPSQSPTNMPIEFVHLTNLNSENMFAEPNPSEVTITKICNAPSYDEMEEQRQSVTLVPIQFADFTTSSEDVFAEPEITITNTSNAPSNDWMEEQQQSRTMMPTLYGNTDFDSESESNINVVNNTNIFEVRSNQDMDEHTNTENIEKKIIVTAAPPDDNPDLFAEPENTEVSEVPIDGENNGQKQSFPMIRPALPSDFAVLTREEFHSNGIPENTGAIEERNFLPSPSSSSGDSNQYDEIAVKKTALEFSGDVSAVPSTSRAGPEFSRIWSAPLPDFVNINQEFTDISLDGFRQQDRDYEPEEVGVTAMDTSPTSPTADCDSRAPDDFEEVERPSP